ncbi:hypothetical protein PSI22_20830, partial [Xenorhabdus sp. XENO-7]|nr:hypothetical protein [Xenorhabdus aichiensis]
MINKSLLSTILSLFLLVTSTFICTSSIIFPVTVHAAGHGDGGNGGNAGKGSSGNGGHGGN